MSEKRLEWCSMEDATHVEVNGQSYFLGSGKVLLAYDEDDRIGISIVDACAFIPVDAFPLLGIKPLRERKRESRECTALTVIAQRNGKDVVALLPTDDFELGMTVRCVEILEDEE